VNAKPAAESPAAEAETAAPLQAITEALRGLRFGSVTIIVQDGVIVQVERIEKRRLRGQRSEIRCQNRHHDLTPEPDA